MLIPSNRIAPVTASGLASLNALAPGRIDFGVSTGFTARRTIGLRPVKLADMAYPACRAASTPCRQPCSPSSTPYLSPRRVRAIVRALFSTATSFDHQT